MLSIVGALIGRESLRIARQPTRLIAGIATAALVWALLASGLSRSLAPGGYAAFLLPGMSAMVVLFASMFAGISLIEDRREGLLRALLVSPAPRAGIAIGKALGCSLLAAAQGAVLLPAAAFLGADPGWTGWPLALAALVCMALGVSGLSLALAWRVGSVEGFHGVMNLVLMPLWLLSGALFPTEGMSPWLAWIARLDPLHWTMAAMRAAIDGAPPDPRAWAATIAWGLLGLGLAWAVMARTPARSG